MIKNDIDLSELHKFAFLFYNFSRALFPCSEIIKIHKNIIFSKYLANQSNEKKLVGKYLISIHALKGYE